MKTLDKNAFEAAMRNVKAAIDNSPVGPDVLYSTAQSYEHLSMVYDDLNTFAPLLDIDHTDADANVWKCPTDKGYSWWFIEGACGCSVQTAEPGSDYDAGCEIPEEYATALVGIVATKSGEEGPNEWEDEEDDEFTL